MLQLFVALTILGICSALPYYEKSPQNVITVPPNCPEGQEWVNGACRDIWNIAMPAVSPALKAPSDIDTQNMITVPTQCPPGQQLINGKCRDVWRGGALAPADADAQNMITVPTYCPPGQELINGKCRDVWRGGALADSEPFRKLVESLWAKSAHQRNSRQVEDLNDDTLPEFENEDKPNRNIISVPNQCPEGYKPDAFGICRKQL